MNWPSEFYEWKRGHGCPICAEGRSEETPDRVRFFAGAVLDAYLRRTDIQRGLTVAIWRGRHVAEPTELTEEEAATYWPELRLVGKAIETTMQPLKMNYNLLGNSVPHLHTHIVPRYADDPKPSWPFPFPDPEPPAMPKERLDRDVAALRECIERMTSRRGDAGASIGR
jgi:diadenosine tetraphosphate (Ap4A) HIT family hydrolase